MEGYSLKKFFRSPLPIRYLPYLFICFSILGFFDLAYLTIQHYNNVIPPCTIHGCDLVLTSKFAVIAGMPLSLLGAGYYFLNIIGMGLSLQIKRTSFLSSLFAINVGGLIVGATLIFLQAFVIHAFCQYCLFGELMIFLMFDTVWWMYNSFKKE